MDKAARDLPESLQDLLDRTEQADVVIHVSGGVVQSWEAKDDLDLCIVDWDDLGAQFAQAELARFEQALGAGHDAPD